MNKSTFFPAGIVAVALLVSSSASGNINTCTPPLGVSSTGNTILSVSNYQSAHTPTGWLTTADIAYACRVSFQADQVGGNTLRVTSEYQCSYNDVVSAPSGFQVQDKTWSWQRSYNGSSPLSLTFLVSGGSSDVELIKINETDLTTIPRFTTLPTVTVYCQAKSYIISGQSNAGASPQSNSQAAPNPERGTW